MIERRGFLRIGVVAPLVVKSSSLMRISTRLLQSEKFLWRINKETGRQTKYFVDSNGTQHLLETISHEQRVAYHGSKVLYPFENFENFDVILNGIPYQEILKLARMII